MKICIPSEGKEGLAAKVYGHFGSAPYFTLYDTVSREVEVIDNADRHHAHGMCHPLLSLADRKVDVVVTAGMGGRAVQKLNEACIKAFRAIPGTVADTLRRFAEGGLQEITPADACAHHGCH